MECSCEPQYVKFEKLLLQTNFYLSLQDSVKDKIWSVFRDEQIQDIFNNIDLKKGYNVNEPKEFGKIFD